MSPSGNGKFAQSFIDQFRELLIWRRDVRRFRPDPLPDGLLEELIGFACLSPSVGLSEPWRFVSVRSPVARLKVREQFATANQLALSEYSGEQATLYARLKLAGLDSAPVHLAVFADQGTTQGSRLGRRTMPETLEYSVVLAIHTLWLAARAHGIGLGWVSILEPKQIAAVLDLPGEWQLIGYLCLGYPEEEWPQPELERAGWEKRSAKNRLLER